MGDPKKHRKKFVKPGHPWEKARIDEEKIISKEYGLVNKQEIWKMDSHLKKIKAQVKKMIAATGKQAEKEKTDLMKRVKRLGLAKENSTFEELLRLSLKDILERRLQTLVFRKGLARGIKQSRQFIIHGHIILEGKKMTVPSYIVPKDSESKIEYTPKSSLSNSDHPERTKKEKKKPKERPEKPYQKYRKPRKK